MVEIISKSKREERGREVVDLLVKSLTKDKMGEIRRETINWFVELRSKCEVGKRVWEIFD